MNPHNGTSLCGTWKFQIDPKDLGTDLGWFQWYADRGPWRDVSVPGHWDFYGEELWGYQGPAWFARTFELNEHDARRVFLRFEAVNYHATVWVNACKVTEHGGGFTPFQCEITDAVDRRGENLIVVRVENVPSADRLPPIVCGWFNYGGISREVSLITTGPVSIQDVFVRGIPEGRSGRIRAEVAVQHSGTQELRTRVELAVTGLSVRGEQVKIAPIKTTAEMSVQPGEPATIALETLIEEARRWCPEDPALYRVEITVSDSESGQRHDAVCLNCGVRSIAVRGQELLLNGEPIYLLGVNRHEEYAETGRVDPDGALARRDMEMIQKMGANIVRTCHYPHHPRFYDLADEAGMLIWDEIPLYWWGASWAQPNERTAAAEDVASEMLEEMIRRDRNHPSIIFWGLSNECDTYDERGVELTKRLMERARALDDTRIISYASGTTPDDASMSLPELIGCNMYAGIFGGKGKGVTTLNDIPNRPPLSEKLIEEVHEKHPDRPILITEFGLEGIRGLHGDTYGTEEVQAEALRSFAKMYASKPYVVGQIVWSFADYRYPTSLAKIQTSDFVCRGTWGIVDMRRRPKLACEALAQVWREIRREKQRSK